MIVHLIINSLVIFVFMALAIQLFLLSFRIKNSRIRYLCCSLPFLKIPFDLAIFIFYGDSLFINLNPFSCEIYLYELLQKIFPGQLAAAASKEHLVIPQYIAGAFSPFWLDCMTICAVSVGLLGVVRRLYALLSSKIYLNRLINSALPFKRAIFNSILREKILEKRVVILVSSAIEVPCAIGASHILLPKNIVLHFSDEELEAVIAHELEHLQWKDPFFNFFFSLLSSICWWIPTKHWLKILVREQESGSDAAIYAYGIENSALAAAVAKILCKVKKNNSCALVNINFLAFFQKSHSNRLKHILDLSALSANHRCFFKDFLVLFFALLIFLSFWMC